MTNPDTIIDNINFVSNLINQINNDIEDDNINFNNIIRLIDSLFLLSNSIVNLNSPNIIIDEYNEKLTLALNAFENKDFILFNDILQYELKPALEFWMENIV